MGRYNLSGGRDMKGVYEGHRVRERRNTQNKGTRRAWKALLYLGMLLLRNFRLSSWSPEGD